jgi:hypothetical protein
MVGQFSFESCPVSHEISSAIYQLPRFGKLACHPTLLKPLLLYLHFFSTESSAPCPTCILLGKFRVPPPPLLLVLGYSLLFTFIGGEWFSLPKCCAGLCSQGVSKGVALVVHDTHLFVLQLHPSSFETGWWGEMALCREAFHGLGVQDIAEFDSD